MREAAFVKQNKDKWLKFERLVQNNMRISPGELSILYVELTEDLNYAQTFYPHSETLAYLNELSAGVHQKIYKTKKESKNKIYQFYTQEFPLFFYEYRSTLLLAFLLFLGFSAIGAYSAASDDGFVRLILGDAYVNSTLENIDQGDPMAVYKKANQTDMFLGITLNNIKVALFAFVAGILAGLGTIYILLQNAIMLGSFQYFFYDEGILWESARTIWIHGTIEISVIIVAACAGLVMGKSLLFPKTYTRLESFTQGVKAGLKIVISTIPFFIIAGFLEGFVTRLTGMPDWLAILIIASSFILIVYYYVILPLLIHKQHAKQLHRLQKRA
ncbi:stage II sporulation protein M [Psychroflexus sp. YR1-1]|uniref:Stage II sporulation protein M n=1 Tax=Psychroflexus aurantiacus TaxID=2709310 RepID=A0A6B3R222_9FLAO|nr:stage II sporulation protein M [Psychroflexus aurantiacus]NEV93520.1 stage II sporulation protein M [Psychroflexus aurantiacus]